MAKQDLTTAGFLTRLVVAVLLVLFSYNPSHYSYFHWLRSSLAESRVGPTHAFVGVVLLIGWVVFLRASWRSLGVVGLLLTFGFFGTLVWLLVDVGIVPAGSTTAITWITLVSLAGVLSIGMSWSHIRRRASGQVDTDEVED